MSIEYCYKTQNLEILKAIKKNIDFDFEKSLFALTKIDKSENKEIKINHTPIILSATNCIEGNGKALVIYVGERSTKGKFRRMVDNSKDEKITPLQRKIGSFAKKISTFAICVGAATFICLT